MLDLAHTHRASNMSIKNINSLISSHMIIRTYDIHLTTNYLESLAFDIGNGISKVHICLTNV